MRKPLGIVSLILFGVFASANYADVDPKDPKVNLTSGVSGDWGTPLTLQTGREIFGNALECMNTVLTPNFRHDYSQAAFANLLKLPNAANIAVIGGHGKPGAMCTGEGDHCNSLSTVMSKFTEPNWVRASLDIRRRFKAVRLLGCDMGAEQIGADFLFEIARHVDMPVIAPTYLVYCGNGKVFLDPAAKWQIATPSHKPDPIELPKFSVESTKTYQFKIQGKMVPIPSESVHVLAFQYTSEQLGSKLNLLDVGPATELSRLVDFGHPYEPGGTPLAMATGYFRLRLSINGKNIDRRFKLYNDEIVQDLANEEVYYHVDSRLGERLQSLRLR